MEKLLLITGELAENKVTQIAKELNSDVLILPVSVAQFVSPKIAIDEIKKLKKDYNQIIFPGLTRFDVSLVEKEVNIPCFKGSKNPTDLPELLEKKIKLSKTHSADNLIEKKGLEDYKELTHCVEKNKERFKIGDLKIGDGFPPRIIAEIVDAPLLTKEQALKRARCYIKSGADIIDVGAVAAEDNSEKLHYIIKYLKENLDCPVSIDSLNPKEINSGLDAGADLVLSLCSENLDEIKEKDASYVIIPDSENSLEQNLKLAKELGFKNLIADPILHPPFKIAKSLSKYLNLSHPSMMGVGNVVELIDADSVGINALLGAIAVELGVCLLLTTENSPKTKNSIKELKRAIELSFLAHNKSTLPKDLGFDLLVSKTKTSESAPKLSGNIVKVPEKIPKFSEDVKGHFIIHIDFEKNQILAQHPKTNTTFVGPTAESLAKKIIEKEIVSNLEHAAYLGRELQKAEIYLKLGRGYVQDEDFVGLL